MRLLLGGLTEAQSGELFSAVRDLAEPAGTLTDLKDLEKACRKARPDVVALHLGPRPSEVLGGVARLRAFLPAVTVLAIVDHASRALIQQVTEAGCTDLVVLRDCPTDLRRALHSLGQRERLPTIEGTCVAVLGAKGGVGTTTLALNLADALSQRPNARVVVVDLDLLMGDLAQALAVRPRPSALWFLLRGAVVDARTWLDAPPSHEVGFRVLGLDGDVNQTAAVSASQVVHFLESLRSCYDHVVVDLGSRVSEVSLAACTVADHRLLVVEEGLASRLAARRRVEILSELELQPAARCVANRVQGAPGPVLQSLESDLGIKASVAFPAVARDTEAAFRAGQPVRVVAPGSAYLSACRQLVETLVGEVQETERRKRAFFGFFR